MTHAEDALRAAVTAGDSEYDDTRERSMRDVLATSFRGKMRAAGILVYGCLVTFAASTVIFAYQFLMAETIKDTIMYAGLCGASFLTLAVVKVWYWMLVHRNALMREIKRVELRVALLTDRIGDRPPA